MKRELYKATDFKRDIQKLDLGELKKAIVLKEVLDKPLALRRRTIGGR